MVIYKVTNLVNGKVYIGKTIRTMEERKREHVYRASHTYEKSVFHKALVKYGDASFTWEIIDHANTENELLDKETYWIKSYNSYINTENSNGYNMTLGGEGTSGHRFKEESKQIMREISKGSKNNMSKLHEDDVLKIKELIKSRIPLTTIANEFNVNIATISDIKVGNTWKHIGDDVSYIDYSIKHSILDKNDVLRIKFLLKDGKFTTREIAIEFNVSYSTINEIKLGKRWASVGEDVSNLRSRAKLKEEDVKEIKLLLEKGNLKQYEIANIFNVSPRTIRFIKQGKTWKNVVL